MIVPKKLPRDSNQRAYEIVRISTGEVKAEVEPEPSPESARRAEIGRKGGKKGGKARAMTLSAERRSAISARAAQVRWSKGK